MSGFSGLDRFALSPGLREVQKTTETLAPLRLQAYRFMRSGRPFMIPSVPAASACAGTGLVPSPALGPATDGEWFRCSDRSGPPHSPVFDMNFRPLKVEDSFGPPALLTHLRQFLA